MTPSSCSQQRKSVVEKEKEVEDDDIDFGDDDSDDDDDAYEEDTKALLPWQKKRQQATRTSKRLSHHEDDDEVDDDDEAEETMMGRPSLDVGPVVEADLDDYIKITLPRRRLARWCKEPFFEQAVLQCFVRLLIGDHDGKKCYRLCRIVDVIKGKKSYNFPSVNPQEKPVSFLFANSFETIILWSF